MGGSRAAPPLKLEGEDQIPVIETVPSLFQRVDTTLSGVVAQFSNLAENARTLLSRENLVAVAHTLENLQALTATLAAHREDLATALTSAATTLGAGQEVTHQLGTTLTRFASVAESLEQMAREFTRTGQQINTLLRENGQGLTRLTEQTLPNLNQLIGELRQMTNNLNRLVQLLQQQPSALLFGRQAPGPGPGER
jgi:phospholipid/cholesterol/gamma-HCH transport system substrate-binding protein